MRSVMPRGSRGPLSERPDSGESEAELSYFRRVWQQPLQSGHKLKRIRPGPQNIKASRSRQSPFKFSNCGPTIRRTSNASLFRRQGSCHQRRFLHSSQSTGFSRPQKCASCPEQRRPTHQVNLSRSNTFCTLCTTYVYSAGHALARRILPQHIPAGIELAAHRLLY
jgi:hypothetical protein